MRFIWFPVLFGALSAAVPAQAEDILQVLDRSQQARLDALLATPAPGVARSRIVRASFEALLHALPLEPRIQLRTIDGPVLAETLHGTVVVANVQLADLPETARRFVLAHEIGHVMLGHWSQMGMVYQRWIPGPVERARTDSVAAPLGREASALAHRQEFEADAYAARLLNGMGVPPRDLYAVFLKLGVYGETATHPSLRKRIAALRDLGLPETDADLAGARTDDLSR